VLITLIIIFYVYKKVLSFEQVFERKFGAQGCVILLFLHCFIRLTVWYQLPSLFSIDWDVVLWLWETPYFVSVARYR